MDTEPAPRGFPDSRLFSSLTTLPSPAHVEASYASGWRRSLLLLLPLLLALCHQTAAVSPPDAASLPSITSLFSSSSSFASSSSSSSSLPSNSTALPLCSTRHPLFTLPLHVLGDRLFPLSPHLTPFPPGSFLPRCPNLNATLGSCCNFASVEQAHRIVAEFTAQRDRFLQAALSLSPLSLYDALTNSSSSSSSSSAGANPGNSSNNGSSSDSGGLSAAQKATLQSLTSLLQRWANASVTCVDHWMSYIVSSFCLACDPHRAFVFGGLPWLPPVLVLHESVCDAVYSRCAPLLLRVFAELPELFHLLQSFFAVTPAFAANVNSMWFGTYLNWTAVMAVQRINPDMCLHGEVTDCQHFFCVGSSVDGEWGDELEQHAFRGLNYGFNSRTLAQFMDLNAFLAYAVCLLRAAASNTTASVFVDNEYADGCLSNGNLLHLLAPAVFPYQPVDSTWDVPYPIHDMPREQFCCPWRLQEGEEAEDWEGAQKAAAAAASPREPPIPLCNSSCDWNGLARTVWSNSTQRGWAAYDVGCSLNLSRHICELPDWSPPTPSESGVSALSRLLFLATVAVCLTALLLVTGLLCLRYRNLREERSTSQLVESEQEWVRFAADGDSLALGRHSRAMAESPRAHLLR